jgi:DNA-binding NarL/FixJ family response regulator
MIELVPSSVLVVDDDSAFRATARLILHAAGLCVVGEAGTAVMAAIAALDLRPDAVLVDVGLPDDDGIALAGRLAALPWSPRVLLTSTDPDAAGPGDIQRCGACGFLPKQDLPDAPLDRIFLRC